MHDGLKLMLLAAVATVCATGSVAGQDFFDDFEAYTAGQGIIGQAGPPGGWEGWDDDPAADAPVSTAFSSSGQNSVEIGGPDTDVVQILSGVDSGWWEVSAKQYIPGGGSGVNFFILLNEYVHNGNQARAAQLPFDLDAATLTYGANTVDLVTDDWVDLRLLVDLGANRQHAYYDDTLIFSGAWATGGLSEIQAIDLYGNGASPVYYDDVGVRAVPLLTWDNIQSDNWDSAHWLGGPPSSPDATVGAMLDSNNTHTVTVAADAAALNLTADGGGIAIADGRSLTVTFGADFAAGTSLSLGTGSTLTAGGGSIYSGVVTTGSSTIGTDGALNVASLDVPAGATFTKSGSGELSVDQDGVTAGAGSIFQIDAGTLVARGANPIGQSTRIDLNGGTFAFGDSVTPGTPPAGPVAHWAFDETTGSTAVNSASPGTNDGTLVGLATDDSQWVPGKIGGGALHFEGNGFVDAATADPIWNLTAGYTVSLWAKADSVFQDSAFQSVFSGGETADTSFQIDFDDVDRGNYRWRGSANVNMGPVDTDWLHLAATYDGVTLSTYYNGQLAAQTATSGSNFVKYLIGRNRANDWFFKGAIDDVRVYNYALADTEVDQLFGTRAAPDLSATTVVVTADSGLEARTPSGATVGTLELRQGILTTAGVAPITFNNAYIPAGTTGTVGLDPQVMPVFVGGINANGSDVTFAKGGPSTWVLETSPVTNLGAGADWGVQDGVLDVQNPAALEGRPMTVSGGELRAATLGGSTLTMAGGTFTCTDSVAAGTPPVDAVANWKFDDAGGTTAVDSGVPGDKTGTLIGFPDDDSQWVDGIDGGALAFDGVDDYVDTSYPGIDGANPRTVAFWIRSTDITNHGIVAWGDSTTPGEKWHLRLNATAGNGPLGAARTEIQTGRSVAATIISDGNWHHVVSVLPDMVNPDATDVLMYVDGVLDAPFQTNATAVNTDTTSPEAFPVTIGRREQVGTMLHYAGLIDEVHIFDRAVSQAEIEAMSVITLADLSDTNVLVTADSVIASASRAATAFGDLSMQSGVLTTSGRNPISFGSTTVVPVKAHSEVGFDPQVATDYGVIDASSADVTLVKAGPSTWPLAVAPLNLDSADWRVDDGLLELTGTQTLGNRPVTVAGGTLHANGAAPIGTSAITLAGGTFRVTSDEEQPEIPAGAIAYYSFNNPGNLGNDDSGNGMHGVPVGNPTGVAGILGGAADFDGDDGLNVDNGGSFLKDETDVRSVAFWLNHEAPGGNQMLFDEGGGTHGLGVRMNGSLVQARIRTGGGGGTNVNIDSVTDLTPGWHHVGVVYGNSTFSMFIDGAEVDSDAAFPLLPRHSNGPGIAWVNNANPGGLGGSPLNGLLDEFYIYQAALEADDMAALIAAAGWSPGPLDVTNAQVTVTADSVLMADHPQTVTFGSLTLESGALTTTGALNVVFDGGTTIVDMGAPSEVGFDPQCPTDYGAIDASFAPVTIYKTGPSTWNLGTAPDNLAEQASWRVDQGELALEGSQTLGNLPVTVTGGVLSTAGAAPIGTSEVILAGGTLQVDEPAAKAVPPDPIAYYTLNNPYNLGQDSSGNANHGTEVGNPSAAAGVVSGAGSFDGIDDGVNLDQGGGFLENETDARTVAFWIYQADAAGDQMLFDEGGVTNGFGIQTHNGELQAKAKVSPDEPYIFDPGGALEQGWHHVAFVYGDSQITLYLDGSQLASAATPFASIPSHTDNAGIGYLNNENAFATAGFYGGLIDEFYIYSTAVDAAGIGELYDAGSAVLTPLDMTATDITLTGDSTLDARTAADARFGSLTITGGTLTTAGAAGGIEFAGGTTLAAAAGDTVGFNALTSADPGVLTADGVTPTTIAKTGPAALVMQQQPVGLSAVTFDVQAGPLVGVKGAAKATEPFGAAAIVLSGGELVLAGGEAQTDVAYDTPVSVAADSTLTAGTGFVGADGPLTVTYEGAGNLQLGGATLALRSTGNYRLSVTEVIGPGGVEITGGDVTLGAFDVASMNVAEGTLNAPAGGIVEDMLVTGGVLSAGADIEVTTMRQTGGQMELGENRIVVSDRLAIELVNYTISSGDTFGAAGTNLLDSADLTLSGGTTSVDGPQVPGGAIALWQLDEPALSLLAADSSGNNYVGSIFDATPGEAGAVGSAYRFDGDNDYVDFGPDVFEMDAPGAFSASIWFNRRVDNNGTDVDTNHNVNNVLLAQCSNATNDNLEIGTETDTVELYVDTDGTDGFTAAVPGGISNNAWHHLMVTFDQNDADELKLYFDGQFVQQWDTPDGALIAAVTSPLTLGMSRPGDDPDGDWGDFDGLIDEVYLYDRALGVYDIEQIYGLGTSGGINQPGTNIIVTADSTLQMGSSGVLGNLAVAAGVNLEITGAEENTFGGVSGGHDATVIGSITVEGDLAPGGSTGRLNVVGTLEIGENGTYRCEIQQWDSTTVPDPWNPVPPSGPVNDRVDVGGGDFLLGGELSLEAIGRLHPPVQAPGQPPGVMVEWYGDQTRTIASAVGDNSIRFAFDTVTDAQPEVYDLPGTGNWGQGHLGHGAFLTRATGNDPPVHPGITYTLGSMQAHLFQAADGDTNGDRLLGSLDIQAILSANTFPDVQPADWPQGDFTGDGWCNGLDIQAILATGLYPFLPGPYAAVDSAPAGDQVVDLLLYTKDYAGPDYPPGQAGMLALVTDGATVNGYVIRSEAGIFTGGPAENRGWFAEDGDHQISGNMGFTLDGSHLLGEVLGPEWLTDGNDWHRDLTFTYTIQAAPGTFVGNLIVVPEPGTIVMLICAAAALLLWRMRRRGA